VPHQTCHLPVYLVGSHKTETQNAILFRVWISPACYRDVPYQFWWELVVPLSRYTTMKTFEVT
jgi:hypothetical protein